MSDPRLPHPSRCSTPRTCEACGVAFYPFRAAEGRFCNTACRVLSSRKGPEPTPVSGARWIPISNGKWTLVDEDRFDHLNNFPWSGGGSREQYAVNHELGYMHAVVFGASDPDHRNGDPLDNRRSNLRAATRQQQTYNMASRAKIAKYKGISMQWNGTWSARIRLNSKYVSLGTFATQEEAAHAYDEAARRHHGEFACVNFPKPGERGAR